jgi:hypothetical protein
VSPCTCWHISSWKALTVDKTTSASNTRSYCIKRERVSKAYGGQSNESWQPPQSALPVGNLSYVTVQHLTLNQVRRRFTHHRLFGLF